MQRRAALFTMLAPVLRSQSNILPLAELSPDAEGFARTVFRGREPEQFPVRILGILRNSGPDQNIILARLLTERLEHTGVMQGMSGSPVYVQGRLIGAIAFAFPFAKEPIAGIRPIEEMLAVSAPTAPRVLARLHLGSSSLLPEALAAFPSDGPMPVLTPVSLSGLSASTIQHFAPAFRQMGLALQQGASGAAPGQQADRPLVPGDMISVQLMRGDMTAGADGTVTHIEGSRIFAFGHRFLAAGEVELPFARAEVLTPLANLNQPFKISQSLAPAGTIRFDGDAAISGQIGPIPTLTPLRIRYQSQGFSREYSVELVKHPILSPLLLQMAAFSTLDRHFRSAGAGTLEISLRVNYPGQDLPLLVQNRYTGDNNLPLAASLGTALPFAFFQQNSPTSFHPTSIELTLLASQEHQPWVVDQFTASHRRARPGSTVILTTRLLGHGGAQQMIETPFPIPTWLEPNQTLTITAADAFTTNLLDFRTFYQPGGPTFRSSSHLAETLNRLHPNHSLHIRAMRASPAFQSAGQELGNLPPSIAAALQRAPGAYLPTHQSRILEERVLLPTGTVSGSRYLTLEIEK